MKELKLKKGLWEGDVSSLVKRLKQLGKGILSKVNNKLNFYVKQPNLFNYSSLGSSIVESAIRGIIMGLHLSLFE